MKQQQGFTLIELIIVIVILGILAVTAAPRFIDIQSDARRGALEGVQAAVQGASQLVYAKSAIAGTQKADPSSITLSNETVPTSFGYPDADGVTSGVILQRFVDIELTVPADSSTSTAEVAGEFTYETLTDSDDTFRIRYSSIETTSEGGCYLQYVSASGEGQTPTVTLETTRC